MILLKGLKKAKGDVLQNTFAVGAKLGAKAFDGLDLDQDMDDSQKEITGEKIPIYLFPVTCDEEFKNEH